MSEASTRKRISLPRLHTAQEQVLNEAARFNTLAMGRRWGKSTLAVRLLTLPALEGFPVSYYAPTYKNLLEQWRQLVEVLQPVATRINASDNRIELVTGGVVELWSLKAPDVSRGRKYKRVVIDEAAAIPLLEEAWTKVIRATLADFEGDGWFLSTPRGANYFKRLFDRGRDDQERHYKSWQMPTLSNPFINPDEVELARQDLPERVFAQEYLAVFLEDSGGVFRHVQAAANVEPGSPYKGTFVIGADWGRQTDATWFIVMDAKTRTMVDSDRFTRTEYAIQRMRLKTLCEKWNPVAVIAEENAMGGPIVEQLQRDGVPVRPFYTTNASKQTIIDALSLGFERGQVRIFNDSVLVAELQAYECERLPSGLLRYGAPQGMHDDGVMALALAYHGTRGGDGGPQSRVLDEPIRDGFLTEEF